MKIPAAKSSKRDSSKKRKLKAPVCGADDSCKKSAVTIATKQTRKKMKPTSGAAVITYEHEDVEQLSRAVAQTENKNNEVDEVNDTRSCPSVVQEENESITTDGKKKKEK